MLFLFTGLENHLASEHDLNPTLETRRVNQILNSNLGLDQTVNWEEREIDTNANKTKNNKDTSLDDDVNDKQALLDPDDVDPTVRQLKKQLSQLTKYPISMTNENGIIQKITITREEFENDPRTIALIDKAIELDANNAQAYAWKCCTLGQTMFRGFSDRKPQEIFTEAKQNLGNFVESSSSSKSKCFQVCDGDI